MPEGGIDPGAVLDPAALQGLDPAVAEAVRMGLADQLHTIFLLLWPLLAVQFVATLFIKALPLRDALEEPGRELLDSMAQTSAHPDDIVPVFHSPSTTGARSRERVMGFRFHLLADEANNPERSMLRRAIAEVGDGDLARGQRLLQLAGEMLTTEDPEVAANREKYAAEVANRVRNGSILSPGLRVDLATVLSDVDRSAVVGGAEPTVAEQYVAVDVARLGEASTDLAVAFLADVSGRSGTAGSAADSVRSHTDVTRQGLLGCARIEAPHDRHPPEPSAVPPPARGPVQLGRHRHRRPSAPGVDRARRHRRDRGSARHRHHRRGGPRAARDQA
ncbi:hypothetical protein [Tessaracoccus coleopterorum]|uniref:hypothetical protein n=1 Tax=Tessaracoccus coleopterorum TaxID=2714950 RepID=UPI0018D2A06C|nr:hypothetical protein [Tessaracoccus coleopterorum]